MEQGPDQGLHLNAVMTNAMTTVSLESGRQVLSKCSDDVTNDIGARGREIEAKEANDEMGIRGDKGGGNWKGPRLY